MANHMEDMHVATFPIETIGKSLSPQPRFSNEAGLLIIVFSEPLSIGSGKCNTENGFLLTCHLKKPNFDYKSRVSNGGGVVQKPK